MMILAWYSKSIRLVILVSQINQACDQTFSHTHMNVVACSYSTKNQHHIEFYFENAFSVRDIRISQVHFLSLTYTLTYKRNTKTFENTTTS